MKLPDKANTETFAYSVPAEISLKVKKKPFIVVTGYDLLDLNRIQYFQSRKKEVFSDRLGGLHTGLVLVSPELSHAQLPV